MPYWNSCGVVLFRGHCENYFYFQGEEMTKLDHCFHKHSPVCWNMPFWCYKWRKQNSASFNFKIVSTCGNPARGCRQDSHTEGSWRVLIKHNSQSHWTRMDFQRTLEVCVLRRGVGISPCWVIHLPQMSQVKKWDIWQTVGNALKKKTFLIKPQNVIGDLTPHAPSPTSRRNENSGSLLARDSAHCEQKLTPFLLIFNEHAALCQRGPVTFSQHSVFLTVSPWSVSPQNKTSEIPMCLVCL